MRRVSVVGNSGSGKTTLARTLAQRLGLAHIELDGLFHGPGWAEPAPEDFRRRVGEALDARGDGWACCGNYSVVLGSDVWPRADTVVVLELPRRTVMGRITRRTLRRVLSREELWNGNREPLRNLYAWNPERNIIRWAWVRHDLYRDRYRRAAQEPRWGHLEFVFLTSPAEVDAFVATVDAGWSR